ncbi:hypothetical protein MRX96_054964 [Rhipicephalus microplus]
MSGPAVPDGPSITAGTIPAACPPSFTARAQLFGQAAEATALGTVSPNLAAPAANNTSPPFQHPLPRHRVSTHSERGRRCLPLHKPSSTAESQHTPRSIDFPPCNVLVIHGRS